MKLIILLALASSSLAACKKEVVTGQTEVVVNRPFNLAQQQTAALPTTGGSVRIALTEVSDSRCPSGAQCIWAGYAAVTVELTDATSTLQTAHLSLRNKPSPAYSLDSVAVTLNQQAYWLRLVEVSPQPATTTGSQPQTATLRLRPR